MKVSYIFNGSSKSCPRLFRLLQLITNTTNKITATAPNTPVRVARTSSSVSGIQRSNRLIFAGASWISRNLSCYAPYPKATWGIATPGGRSVLSMLVTPSQKIFLINSSVTMYTPGWREMLWSFFVLITSTSRWPPRVESGSLNPELVCQLCSPPHGIYPTLCPGSLFILPSGRGKNSSNKRSIHITWTRMRSELKRLIYVNIFFAWLVWLLINWYIFNMIY